MNQFSQLQQFNTNPISLFVRPKKIRKILPFGRFDGAWRLKKHSKTPMDSKHLSCPGTWVIKTLGHSST